MIKRTQTGQVVKIAQLHFLPPKIYFFHIFLFPLKIHETSKKIQQQNRIHFNPITISTASHETNNSDPEFKSQNHQNSNKKMI